MNRILKFKQTDDQKVYWSSDFHLGHNPKWPIPIWKQRGFDSVNEMNYSIIKSINDTVRISDILFFLGDFCLNTTESQFEEFLSRINCQTIYTLWGNHNSQVWDVYKKSVKRYLEKMDDDFTATQPKDDIEIYPIQYRNLIFIGNYVEIVVDGRYYILQHYPVLIWNNQSSGVAHLTGHSHGNLPFSQPNNLESKILDVGWDLWKKPLSTKEVLDIMNKKSIYKSEDHHGKK